MNWFKSRKTLLATIERQLDDINALQALNQLLKDELDAERQEHHNSAHAALNTIKALKQDRDFWRKKFLQFGEHPVPVKTTAQPEPSAATPSNTQSAAVTDTHSQTYLPSYAGPLHIEPATQFDMDTSYSCSTSSTSSSSSYDSSSSSSSCSDSSSY